MEAAVERTDAVNPVWPSWTSLHHQQTKSQGPPFKKRIKVTNTRLFLQIPKSLDVKITLNDPRDRQSRHQYLSTRKASFYNGKSGEDSSSFVGSQVLLSNPSLQLISPCASIHYFPAQLFLTHDFK
jgi:hypothetical protein